ncbi:MAG: competence/damage-inducible protein A [Proteobacteria bacterium]|nr:competence/damage-inducible protein A [Pseudomonadota bacterium]
MKKPTEAALAIIGNEILSGRTQDTNLAYLAKFLNELGIRLMEVRVVPDVESDIIDSVAALKKRYTYVFTTGGIGPTHDDITTASIAKMFGKPIEAHPDALRRLEKHYSSAGQPFNEARRKMAIVPVGATLIDNPISVAPGFYIENVFVLAGVPKIMQAMLDGLRPMLKGGTPMHSVTVSTYLTEGMIASELGTVQEKNPEVEIGSYPFIRDGKLGTSLVMRGYEMEKIHVATAAVKQLIVAKGGAVLSE